MNTDMDKKTNGLLHGLARPPAPERGIRRVLDRSRVLELVGQRLGHHGVVGAAVGRRLLARDRHCSHPSTVGHRLPLRLSERDGPVIPRPHEPCGRTPELAELPCAWRPRHVRLGEGLAATTRRGCEVEGGAVALVRGGLIVHVSDSLHVIDERFSSMSGNVKRRVPCYLAHCTVSVIITVPPVCTR